MAYAGKNGKNGHLWQFFENTKVFTRYHHSCNHLSGYAQPPVGEDERAIKVRWQLQEAGLRLSTCGAGYRVVLGMEAGSMESSLGTI
jgi:hypothetical protein